MEQPQKRVLDLKLKENQLDLIKVQFQLEMYLGRLRTFLFQSIQRILLLELRINIP